MVEHPPVLKVGETKMEANSRFKRGLQISCNVSSCKLVRRRRSISCYIMVRLCDLVAPIVSVFRQSIQISRRILT